MIRIFRVVVVTYFTLALLTGCPGLCVGCAVAAKGGAAAAGAKVGSVAAAAAKVTTVGGAAVAVKGSLAAKALTMVKVGAANAAALKAGALVAVGGKGASVRIVLAKAWELSKEVSHVSAVLAGAMLVISSDAVDGGEVIDLSEADRAAIVDEKRARFELPDGRVVEWEITIL
ncbi:MAG: hypothetical protein AAF354_04055 [Pseudomonadota bacterium]